MTTLSNHVPDPRLITAFAEQRDGPLHRVNPWTKVGVVGALVLAVTVADLRPGVDAVEWPVLLLGERRDEPRVGNVVRECRHGYRAGRSPSSKPP